MTASFKLMTPSFYNGGKGCAAKNKWRMSR